MNFRLVVVTFNIFLSSQLYSLDAEFDESLKHPLSWKLGCHSIVSIKACSLENINEQNFFGYAVLHYTVGATGAHDHFFKTYPQETVNMIKFLLKTNADPNIKNCSERSPFFFLLLKSFDSDHLIPFFIEYKADLNQYDRERTVLHFCDSKCMSVQRLMLLLEYNANPCLTVKKNAFSAPHLGLVDGQYPYEETDNRVKKNLLLHAIPLWIMNQKKEYIETFLQCMHYHKKNNKIAWPPRALQYKILNITSLVNGFKEVKKVQNNDFIPKKEKIRIKNMMDELIAEHNESR